MNTTNKSFKETLDPKIDLIFRALFSKETDCLKDLINSIVHFPKEKEFTQIEVLDPQLFPENGDDKYSIMDIKATSRDGYQFNIEMQMTSHPNYIHRALFYWARFYTERLKKTESYTKLLPTISIHILNFDVFKDSTAYHQEYAILERTTHIPLSNHFEMHFLELPKVPMRQREHLIAWLLFLQNPEAHYMESLMKENPIIEKAHSKLKELSADESLRLIAEARLKAQLDYNSGMEYAKAEGEARGKLLMQKEFLKKLLSSRKQKDGILAQELMQRIENESNTEILDSWLNKALKNEDF